MRILYLTQWFSPEPAHKGIAFVEALAAAGHHVEVATGLPNYPTGRLYPGYRLKFFQREVMRGITIDRLPLYPSHDRSSGRRALNYLSFFVSALVYGLLRGRRFDVVYAYHPPITVGLAAALSGIVSRTPFVLDIQDLWPDTVAASGLANTGCLARMLGPVCRFVYRRAASIVAQSNGMRAKLVERGVPAAKLVTIHNWADEEAIVPRGACDLDGYRFQGRFNIVYAGNFGLVQRLDTLVRAAKLAAKRAPEIQLLLIGPGLDRERLIALVEELDATNVNIHPGVPKAAIADVLTAADVLILHLSSDPLFEITIPSKLQFYLAMGKPILSAVKGEVTEMIVSAGAGVAVAPEDPSAMANAMIALSRQPPEVLQSMGRRARELYLERFSFLAGLAATMGVLENVVH